MATTRKSAAAKTPAAKKSATSSAAKKPAAKKTAAKEPAADKTAAKQPSAKKASAKQPAAKKTAATKSPAKSATKAKSAAPAAPRKARSVTAEQALANTRSLLEQKKLASQKTAAYPGAGASGKAQKAGFVNQAAADRAREQELGQLQHSAIHGFADDTNRENH